MPAAILLVHGAWHGPWCWDDVAGRLAERGHDVRKVRLRGHDGRPGRIWHRLRDYVDDVRQAADGLTEPPVLVGHSLGGLVVQKYLERHPARSAVLMASIPTGGGIGAVGRIAVRHPLVLLKANLLMSLRPFIGTPELVREWFFTPDTSRESVLVCMARLRDESYPAFLETLVRLPRPRRVRAPILVLGAGRDGFFTTAEVRRTARAYRTEAEFFSLMGHDLMLDDGWESVADRIDRWVREGPGRRR
jgi:hypothetical protein